MGSVNTFSVLNIYFELILGSKCVFDQVLAKYMRVNLIVGRFPPHFGPHYSINLGHFTRPETGQFPFQSFNGLIGGPFCVYEWAVLVSKKKKNNFRLC
jgi:hypothetical protein